MRTSPREETTAFVDGACRQCGWRAFSQAENGPACERCGRRVVTNRPPALTCPPVLFLTDKLTDGDAHWRMIRPAVRLKKAGVDASVCWLGADQMPALPVEGRVVVLQRPFTDTEAVARAWVDRLRSAGAVAVVFEIDDDELTGAAIDHLEAAHPLSQFDRDELERRRQALLWTLAACDGATVSTDPLAEVVRRFTDRPVIVVPNAIDVAWFRRHLSNERPWSDHLTIGWAGWRRPDADLAPMAEAWARIARRYPDVRFVVAGHQPDVIYRQDIPLDRFIRVPIVPLDEYPASHQVDIGCCSVADTPFNRCKSPIKSWEYSIAGAAVVTQGEIYAHQPGSLSVVDANGWEVALSDLIENVEGRRFWRELGQVSVERKHSLIANVHRWTDAYARIAEQSERVTV